MVEITSKDYDARSDPLEDMSRNKRFFQVQILHVFRSISICDIFTDLHSY
jgi:hypothetical protein